MQHSLTSLRDALAKAGAELIIRRGPTLGALESLIAETGATLITWNRLFEPLLALRDREIASRCSDLEISTHLATALFEPGSILNGQQQPYRVFTPFWRTAAAQLERSDRPLAAPRKLATATRRPFGVTLESLDLLPRIRWDAGIAATWTPGEAGALAELKAFTRRAANYVDGRNRPDEVGTSRLSPHLHFGEIGPRQVLAALRNVTEDVRATAAYERQLGWREFALHLLHAFPETSNRPLDRSFEQMHWSRKRSQLSAWQRGETGYPLVDAGLRELWQTGWMHNRVRMIVASFLTKNLQQHWRHGARWFWDTLVDADLANNTLGWQWVAGCGADAAPYYRVFNPVLQTERFDPQRAYIRRWIPEIAGLPDRWIHRPWLAPAAVLASHGIKLGVTYPLPLVDLQDSRASALASYRKARSAG